MTSLDLGILFAYLLALGGLGFLYSRKLHNAKDMFAAGGRSPWWVSGLSGFMTMFSAGTFVVWGGIAFRYGMVAVSISMCYGISALLVGRTVAGVWRRYGVDSAAEFLHLRFGPSIVQLYTWLQGALGIFTVGGAVYALAVIVTALVPLGPDHPLHLLADPETGHLSVPLLSIFLCVIVVLVAFSGGLWAVLVTDVLQFIILTLAVVLVTPLCFIEVGGVGAFLEKVPEGFLQPVSGDFTWWFLTGWIVVHYFKIGGDWSFVQRFTCVPSAREARLSSYLFGVMYLVSPLFWMLPPMIYRVMNPDANYEQAYILACQAVLPAGMMGLMVAAMCSATASTATTVLNVYAGALTTEVYQRLIRPDASPERLVFAGRVSTVLLGCVILAGALLIPLLGTYTGYILGMTSLLVGPLTIPTIWGMFSRRIGLRTTWAVAVIGVVVGMLVKFGLQDNGFLTGIAALEPLVRLVQANVRIADLLVGLVIPLGMLIVAELVIQKEHPGWSAIQRRRKAAEAEVVLAAANRLPALLCGWTTLILAAVLAVLAVIDREEWLTLTSGAGLLALVGVTILATLRKFGSS